MTLARTVFWGFFCFVLFVCVAVLLGKGEKKKGGKRSSNSW